MPLAVLRMVSKSGDGDGVPTRPGRPGSRRGLLRAFVVLGFGGRLTPARVAQGRIIQAIGKSRIIDASYNAS